MITSNEATMLRMLVAGNAQRYSQAQIPPELHSLKAQGFVMAEKLAGNPPDVRYRTTIAGLNALKESENAEK